MTALPAWNDLIAGRGCPFCAAMPDSSEYNIKIADLSVSTLRLDRNQTYGGYCVLIFTARHVTGLEQLNESEYAAFTADLRKAMQAINDVVKPDLMNYASLGNVIPHLHFHIIPRTKTDPKWGGPVWPKRLEDMDVKHLPEAEYGVLIEKIRANLAA